MPCNQWGFARVFFILIINRHDRSVVMLNLDLAFLITIRFANQKYIWWVSC